jgi:putative hydrolase of HD superfamily
MNEEKILKFFQEVNKLKYIKRTGWTERGVKNAETSAEHSFMAAFQALVLGSKRDLNMEKVLKMALVHEIAESQVGDMITKEIWPKGGTVTEKEKHDIEKEALEKLLDYLEPEMKNELMRLWLEFEEGKTKEAVFLKIIDKFETILQALNYHRKGNYEKPLEGFWDENKLSLIKDEKLKKLILKAIKNNI